MPTIFMDKVELGPLTFNEGYNPDTQAKWVLDVLDGWDDTPNIDVVLTPRSGDGAISADKYPAKEKYLQIGGMVHCNDRLAAEEGMEEIVRALSGIGGNPASGLEGNEFEIWRTEAGGRWGMRCRLASQIQFSRPVEEGFRWVAQIVAPDPLKYGDVELGGTTGTWSGSTHYRLYNVNDARTYTFANGKHYRSYIPLTSSTVDFLTINNTGTAETFPKITIIGPLTGGWYLLNETTGKMLAFGRNLTTDAIVIDMGLRSAQAQATGESLEFLRVGNYWGLAPGLNIVKLVVAEYNPDARMILTAHSARK